MNDTRTVLSDPTHQHLLGFLDGNRDAGTWLEEHRPGLACFFRSLDGGPKARQKLTSLEPSLWEEVFEIIAAEELETRLQSNHPSVALLFSAAKGNEDSLAELHRHKPTYALLAGVVRQASDRALRMESGSSTEGPLNETTAADVGCLIGELHLRRGEYLKAVEAFSRAIENEPTADAYEGRAQAYQLLASLDVQRAAEMRGVGIYSSSSSS